jgi:signal peptide peptidase SppA
MPDHTLAHLSGRLFNTPLYITPGKLEEIMGVVLPRMLGQAPLRQASDAAPQVKAAQADLPLIQTASGQRIEVIRVFGTLVHRSGWMDAESGLTSYDTIRRQFRAARDSAEVAGILFHLDSNGGEGAGLFPLVDEIYDARGIKPIHAFVDERAYSAGYALASACSVIHLAATGGTGSIGVIAQHMDQSEWNKKTGLAFTPVFAGARKNDFSPHQPLSAEALKVLNEIVQDGYTLFTTTVARNRTMSINAVRDTEAGLYMGDKAIAAGLADGIKTWDQAVEAISSASRQNSQNGGTRMSKATLTQKLTALFTGAAPETVAEAVADLAAQTAAPGTQSAGAVPAEPQAAAVAPEAMAAARKAGADELQAKVGEIITLCELGGKTEMLSTLLKSGKSVDECRTEIVNAKAAASAEQPTTSTVGAGAGDGINYLVKDAEARAAAGKK